MLSHHNISMPRRCSLVLPIRGVKRRHSLPRAQSRRKPLDRQRPSTSRMT